MSYLRVDHAKKHVYEYNGIEGSIIPQRCKEFHGDPDRLYRRGYEYYNLNDWCTVDSDGNVLEWNVEKKEYLKCKGTPRIMSEVLHLLPYGDLRPTGRLL